MEKWAEDAVQLIDHLGMPRAHLVGSSLGACVALQAALDAPARVSSLVLVAGFSELDRTLEINYHVHRASGRDGGSYRGIPLSEMDAAT